MAFKDTYRLEKVYYENMWTLLRSLKALKENPSADEITKVNEMLDDAIACNESIIIIYKNLGELYAEVAEKFADLLADLKAIRDDLEMWKNEINEKIDEVNNYLMGLIRDLDDRVTSLEGRVSDLEDRMTTAENDIDALEGRMDTAEGDIDALEGRMDTAEGDIDALEGRMDTAEGDIDALEGRMDTAEDDIDDLQGDVSDLEQNKQDKLTAGFGIEIDANNEISVDTDDVQEKLIAGQNITLTPDSTDPTKTVIAAAGANYSAGFGIDIDSNDEISVDTNDVQEKLIAGQNITLTPDSTDPTKTVIKANVQTLTAGSGIELNNNAIEVKGLFPYTFSRVILSESNLPTSTVFSSTSDRARYYRHAYVKVFKDTERFVRLNLAIKEVIQGSNLLTMLNGLANKYHFNYGMTLWLSDNTGEQSVKREAITLSKQIVLDNGQYVPYATRSGSGIHPTSEAITLIVPIKANQNYVYAHVTQEVWTLEDADILTNLNDSNVIGAINNLFNFTISSIT